MTSIPELRSSVEWHEDHLELIDQTSLPAEARIRVIKDLDGVVDSIVRLVVRGAPAIGICGAFGVALAIEADDPADREAAIESAERASSTIATARPTAVNLSWAVRRTLVAARRGRTAREVFEFALAEARSIQEEDRSSCRRIGEFGRAELADVRRVLTHCNTGRLATAGWGTALGVIYAKALAGEPIEVFASETRPLLQGARLTAWELSEAGIPVTLVTDSTTGTLISSGRVDAVIVGCDRVARNGDTANKIGTLTHALVARANDIPFYVAGPVSSFDLSIATGDEIPIEERPPDEVRYAGGVQVAANVPAWNPAFDVTPGEYITAFITDVGVIRPPYVETIPKTLATNTR